MSLAYPGVTGYLTAFSSRSRHQPRKLLCVQGLSAAAQDAQVLRWAAIEDEARLDKALAGYNAEAKKRVQDVQTTRQVLSIQNVRFPSPQAWDILRSEYLYQLMWRQYVPRWLVNLSSG